MLLLVIFSSGHHFRMQHGGIAEIGAVSSCEESEWKLGLVDHGCADEERVFEEGKLVVVLHL
jgi:hypothetical protein